MTRGFEDPEVWPRPGNRERVDLGLRSWLDAARELRPGRDRDFAEAFPGTPAGKAMLACVFGASPFLSGLAVRDPGSVRALWERGPDKCVESTLAGLHSLAPDCGEREAARELREARRKVALAVGLADIAGLWDLAAVTAALTGLAEAGCSVGFRVLLTKLASRGAISPPCPEDPERDSGLIALGLGKLGGRELNFSSDIDLILLYDPDILPATRRYEVPGHLMRLARRFIALLAEPTADGRGFRVDLRLRPDPVSTPLVISTKSALQYYDRRGQTWERAAMIKARPVAGDMVAGNSYLSRLEPFIWRAHLDFATVQDLHDIKKRIDAQHRGGVIGEPGQNLKLGRGGIREIEFFAQTHQLIWGGTDPSLRAIPTCDALCALSDAGHIRREVTDALANSYRYLRRAEHRMQMIADKQTHSLPREPARFETLARFLGYADGKAFSSELVSCLRQVERQYESFFELPREMTEASASSALANRSRGETVERLGRMGFRDPGAAFEIIEKWRTGRGLAARDPRALSLLQSLTPSLVIAMCGTENPDLAVQRFDGMIDRLGHGHRTFTLFQANLHVMETVAEILVAAPAIGAILTARPGLVEVLLDPETDGPPPDRQSLERSLVAKMRGADGYGTALDRLREWIDTANFRVGVQVLFHSLDPLDAAQPLTDIAECAVSMLLRRADEALAASHGRVPGASAAIVSSGRLARREVGFGTELDLALYYDAPKDSLTAGPDEITAEQYFSKLQRRLIAGLRGRPGTRRAYDCIAIDRAASLESLAGELSRVSRGRAELCQPRPVAQVGGLARRIRAIVLEWFSATHDEGRLRSDMAALRDGLALEPLPTGPWAVDSRPGGLIDIEVLAHYLRLRAAPSSSEVLGECTTGEVLVALERAGSLAPDDGSVLLDGWQLWTRILTLQNLLGGTAGDVAVPRRLREQFQSAAGTESFEDVESRIDSVANAVRAVRDRALGLPTRGGM